MGLIDVCYQTLEFNKDTCILYNHDVSYSYTYCNELIIPVSDLTRVSSCNTFALGFDS